MKRRKKKKLPLVLEIRKSHSDSFTTLMNEREPNTYMQTKNSNLYCTDKKIIKPNMKC